MDFINFLNTIKNREICAITYSFSLEKEKDKIISSIGEYREILNIDEKFSPIVFNRDDIINSILYDEKKCNLLVLDLNKIEGVSSQKIKNFIYSFRDSNFYYKLIIFTAVNRNMNTMVLDNSIKNNSLIYGCDYMFYIQMDNTVKTLKNRRGETDKLYSIN